MILSMPLKTRFMVYTGITLICLSFLGFFYNWVNIAGFIIFGAGMLILGLYKRELALYLVFLELCLGSFGYLLSFKVLGFNFSLRMLFFIIIMSFWFFDFLRRKIAYNKGAKRILSGLAVFLVIWLIGILRAHFQGNSWSNIFFDANSYAYLFLFFPALSYIDTKEKLKAAIKVLLTGAVIMAFKTVVLFITFVRLDNPDFLGTLYKWIRDFRIGEITPLKNSGYRIFMQSQIYIIFALLFISVKHFFKNINFQKFLCLGALSTGAIYLSLSRSLWIGTAVGIFLMFILMFYSKLRYKKIALASLRILLVIIIGILIADIISPKGGLKNRFEIGEAATDTRMSQLTVLLPAVKNNPIFGYGFGKTLTYKSFDPRLGDSLNGVMYTTDAFEWGYLDIVLKIGVFGLLAYLFFIGSIVWRLFERLKKVIHEERTEFIYSMWAISGLGAVLAIHIFTPYLNHPLGIGMIILAGVVAGIDFEKKTT